MAHRIVTLGALDDCNPCDVERGELGDLFDPFGLIKTAQDYIAGGGQNNPAGDPAAVPSAEGASAAAPNVFSVVVDALNLRVTPGGTSIGLLMRGAAVELLEGGGAELWWHVRDAQGRTGYVAQHDPQGTKPYLEARPPGTTVAEANQAAPAVEVTPAAYGGPAAESAPGFLGGLSTGGKIGLGLAGAAAAVGLYYALS